MPIIRRHRRSLFGLVGACVAVLSFVLTAGHAHAESGDSPLTCAVCLVSAEAPAPSASLELPRSWEHLSPDLSPAAPAPRSAEASRGLRARAPPFSRA